MHQPCGRSGSSISPVTTNPSRSYSATLRTTAVSRKAGSQAAALVHGRGGEDTEVPVIRVGMVRSDGRVPRRAPRHLVRGETGDDLGPGALLPLARARPRRR